MATVLVLQKDGEALDRAVAQICGAPVSVSGRPDLLIVSPALADCPPRRELRAAVALLPGRMAAPSLRARCAVTYGMSPRDTLTLSSFGPEGAVLAVQREVMTVSGAILERQELTIPGGKDPERLLAVYGAMLLLEKMAENGKTEP